MKTKKQTNILFLNAPYFPKVIMIKISKLDDLKHVYCNVRGIAFAHKKNERDFESRFL